MEGKEKCVLFEKINKWHRCLLNEKIKYVPVTRISLLVYIILYYYIIFYIKSWNIFFETTSWNIWNPFSLKLGWPYLWQRPHSSARKVWWKGVESYFFIQGKCFHPKIKTFFTKHFCLPTFIPTYYLPYWT